MSDLFKKFSIFTAGLTLVVWSIGLAVLVPTVSATAIVDGDLVKATGSSAVYLISGATKRVFPHYNVYLSWGYPSDYSTVKTVTAADLAAYTDGSAVPFRDGSLFRGTASSLHGKDKTAVFVVEDGKLRDIVSETVYQALYNDANWKLVTWVPDDLLTKFSYPLGTQLTSSTTHTNGTLVKYSGSSTVYLISGGVKRAISSDTALKANRYYDSLRGAYTVPVATLASTETYSDGSGITGVESGIITPGAWTETAAIGGLTVALASDTPAATYVSKGGQNAVFAKFNFSASGGDSTVSKIVLQRKGLGFDGDIDTVRLYSGTTQLGSDQSMNTTTHKVTFSNVNWTISSGTTKALTVKANINSAPSGTNDYFELVEVTANGTAVGLPVAGKAMSFSALTVGYLDIDALSASSTITVISGATNQELGCWNFITSANGSTDEGVYIDSVKLTNIGSASTADAGNFVLKVGSTTISGTAVAAMASDSTITFDMTAAPYFLDKSRTKKVCVYGDITAGITVAKTLRFQVAYAKDVVARGDSSASEVLITYSTHTAFTSQSAQTDSIAQGSATLAQDPAYAPTTGTIIIKGVPNNKMASYKLTAGSTEGVRLTKLAVVLAGTGVANTDFSNWTLYKMVDGAEVSIPVNGSVSGLNITFEDTSSGLVDVPKSESKTLIIRADVSTSFAGTETGAHIYVGANGTTNTVARIKGLDSGDYVTNGVTLSGVATGNAQTFTGGAKGTLTISKATSSPAADNKAKGSSNVHFTTINFYATGEDVEVTSLQTIAYEASGVTNPVDSGELTNVKLTDVNGVQLGSTVANPTTGASSFSFSFTVPKETNKIIKVYGDIPSGSTASLIHIDMPGDYDGGGTLADADTQGAITSTGVYSSADIGTSETGTCTGSDMTVSTPTIVAAMGSNPVATSYVVNTTGATLGTLLLTAGTYENVKVTSIKISADDANTLNNTSTANTSFSQVKLVDSAGTQYGTTQNFTDGSSGVADYITYSGISNLTVNKGTTKTLYLVADIIGSSTTFYFGVLNSANDITGVGVSSNSAATVTPSGSVIVSAGATLTTVGTLLVSKSADMPSAAQLVSGSTGTTVAKYKFAATFEDIDVTSIPLYYTGTVANISNVKLYVGSAQIGETAGYAFSAKLKTVSLTSGTFVVPKGSSSVLTIKADLGAKDQVITSVSSTYFGIADADGDNSTWSSTGSYNIEAAGVSSASDITATDIKDASGYVWGSNAFTIHKGILTISKNASSPSGSATAGAGKEVLRLDLTATGDDITINEMEFCTSGSATSVTGTGSVTLKSSDGATTYATLTRTVYDTYWDAVLTTTTDYYPMDPGVTNASCFSFGDDSGTTVGKDIATFSSTLSVSAGDTVTVKLYGDTTGAAATANNTLQVSVGPNSSSSYKATTSGVEYEDSSTTDIDLTTTKNLPVDGGSFIY